MMYNLYYVSSESDPFLCVFGCLLKHRLDVNIFYIDITLWRVLTECSSSWFFAFLPCLKKSVSVHLHSHIICCVYIQFFRIVLCCWEHFGTHALIACSLSDNWICGSLFHGRYNIVSCDIDTSQLGHWHQSVVTLTPVSCDIEWLTPRQSVFCHKCC